MTIMSGTRTSPDSKALTIFISAATSEFKADRAEVAALLRNYGAVHVQEEYPTSLYSGNKIQEVIDQSDLVVCLIGYHYGWPFPPNDRPVDAHKGCSWTQWEYDHAREVVRRYPKKRLAVFINNAPPEGPVDERQATFRQRIFEAEANSPTGLFFAEYKGTESLIRNLKSMIENPQGDFADIQYLVWLGIRDAYRQKTVAKWRATIKHSYTSRTDEQTRSLLMQADDPPFIETREFQILAPVAGRQLEFLNPAAFLTGRDTNVELSARHGADWRPISRDAQGDDAQGDDAQGDDAQGDDAQGDDAQRDDTQAGDLGRRSDGNRIIDALCRTRDEQAVLGTVELPHPARLFIVSGSGIGKTTTLAWMEARINGLPTDEDTGLADCPHLAVLLLAGDLGNLRSDQLLDAVADELIRRTIQKAEPWHDRAIRVGLKRDAEDGTLVLIIDGLDHVSNDLPIFMENHDPTGSPDAWARCSIIAAGRPQALHAWRDRPGPGSGVVASYWRFVEPAQFNDDEAEVYLGSFDDGSRLSVVEDNLVGLLHVPRILEYVRTLNADQLRMARTAADIYFSACLQIVRTAMKNPVARRFGPNWEKYAHLDEPPQEQITRMGRMLAALAFMSLCRTFDPADPMPSHDFRMHLDQRRKRQLRTRLNGTREEDLTRQEMQREMADLENDLTAVAAMSAVIGNGVLEDLSAQGSTSLDSVMWANRTVQQFFAALWLARFSEGGDAIEDMFKGQPLEVSAEPMYDSQRARNYVFFPEADMTNLNWDCEGCPNLTRTDVTYELNLFLAEMPRIAIEPRSWVAAVSAWYDPALFAEEAGHMRVWSTEMLYRSWPMMCRLAGRPMDDWWDVPYQKLASHPPGRNRYEISLHKLKTDDDPEPLARLVLDRFLGDFERNLKQGADGFEIASEMIGADNWRTVPAATDFIMGMPPDAQQGVPTGKVDAYWKGELLDRVQTGKSTPLEAAEAGTWAEWFAPGGVGQKGRENDIQWLEELLKPLAAEGRARRLEKPDRDSPPYQKAFADIEARFKTYDETPKENPQSVRSFEMHRFPVLHRWLWLFAPGHKRVIEAYLESLPDLTTVDPSRCLEACPPHPPDDHPAIYTSWYDAWAFCQWVNWHDPESGTHFGFRLPHEPEWEFAARWHEASGQPEKSPREWRWWWGNAFYSDENSLDAEILSKPWAHADGRPSKTRAPADAEPNGLGFHDILGNVWEWTASLYHQQRERDIWCLERLSLHYSRHDPLSRPPVNGQRTMRGGLWYYLSILATSANRFRYVCNDRDFKIGFRVVREPRPRR